MSGVWVFGRNGVATLVQNPFIEPIDGMEVHHGRRKVLVYLPTKEVINSYAQLEQKLAGLGWRRYRNGDPELLQYHKGCDSAHLISLPMDFRNFKPMHMYDIIVKNRERFEVRDQ